MQKRSSHTISSNNKVSRLKTSKEKAKCVAVPKQCLHHILGQVRLYHTTLKTVLLIKVSKKKDHITRINSYTYKTGRFYLKEDVILNMSTNKLVSP